MTQVLAPVEPTLECWSPLRPIPKGSLDFFGNGGVRESNPRSEPHKQHVIGKLQEAVLRHQRRREFPLNCPVEVAIAFFFVRPAGAHPLDRPSTTSTGDVDKLSRLVLDALTQSGTITDDSRVVDLRASGWYEDRAGTKIIVRPARGNDGERLTTAWRETPRPAPPQPRRRRSTTKGTR